MRGKSVIILILIVIGLYWLRIQVNEVNKITERFATRIIIQQATPPAFPRMHWRSYLGRSSISHSYSS
jgi:hypothetical protein